MEPGMDDPSRRKLGIGANSWFFEKYSTWVSTLTLTERSVRTAWPIAKSPCRTEIPFTQEFIGGFEFKKRHARFGREILNRREPRVDRVHHLARGLIPNSQPQGPSENHIRHCVSANPSEKSSPTVLL